MKDPVIASDGHSYERAAIEDWLLQHHTSPSTGAVLPSKVLLPNHALRQAIADFQTRVPVVSAAASSASSSSPQHSSGIVSLDPLPAIDEEDEAADEEEDSPVITRAAKRKAATPASNHAKRSRGTMGRLRSGN
jgi:hypothetical protein